MTPVRLLFLRGALPFLVAASACSSDSFTAATDGGGDASADAASEATSDGAVGACDLDKPFGAPTPVAGLSDPSIFEGDARLSPDELTVFFERPTAGDAGVGGSDLWVATRASRTDPFGPSTLLPGLNTAEAEAHASPSDDLKTLFYSAVRAPAKIHIYVATRQTTAASFTGSTLVTGLGDPSWAYSTPFLDDARQELYFDRLAPTLNDEIYRVPLTGAGVGTPVAIAEINSLTANDLSPVVTRDGLRIFWASNRADLGAKGDYDIWTATRTSPTGPFGAVSNVAELDTVKLESPSWVSPDGCRLYFSSNRSGNQDVYVAERPK